MKMKFINKLILPALAVSGVSAGIVSCSLEEYNPSGFTFETLASSSVEGYMVILNNVYFGMERRMYGHSDMTILLEAGTDLWTSKKNTDNNSAFKYGGISGAMNLNVAKDVINPMYDGIGSCNMAIKMAELAPFGSVEEKNAAVAEAYFMRAVYYYNLVEQFGGITMVTKPAESVDLHPERTDPLTIYREVIIPDLEFAAQWLPVEERTTRPSKKSALGFLARAYLQTVEYDATKAYASKALDVAKDMIADCEAGGTRYGVMMYPTYDEVFAEENNFENTEALWKHRFVDGGNSNNGWVLNMNDELFFCKTTDFPARKFDNKVYKSDYAGGKYEGKSDYEIWGHRADGQFMPSQYLLSRYIQEDGTIDPRFAKTFQTEWNANKTWTWDESRLKTYDRTDAVEATVTKVNMNDLAIRFIMPGEADYAALSASKLSQPYLVVDYADVYDDQTRKVKMTYKRVNRPMDEDVTEVVNPFFGIYPSLMKHNSSNYKIYDLKKKRLGNLNGTFMMRTPEVYLIAAEADIYVNGGTNAMGYINKVRARAGANPLSGTATIQTVLDERARELCGEYVRFYDLKRTGKLSETYLKEMNPDVGDYFRDQVHKVRPFPESFLGTIQGGGAYYQNPGY